VTSRLVRRTLAVAATVALAALPACADDDDAAPLPVVDDIAPAISAVEDQLGGAQHYFEIDATALGVTMWVAGADATTATPYLWVGGQIASHGDPQGAQGDTFGAAQALTFDADGVLDTVADDLPDATLESFSIVGVGAGGVRFDMLVRSDAGGELSVQVDGQGRVIATDIPPPSIAPTGST
jgi:hypothetical protein